MRVGLGGQLARGEGGRRGSRDEIRCINYDYEYVIMHDIT